MKASPLVKSGRYRVWLWPIRLIGRRWNKKIPPGLWLVNKFYQSVLDINNDVPWMVHFTSRVTGKVTIGSGVWLSFAVSGGCYIQGGNSVFIDDGTIFAPNVQIISANHDPIDYNKWENGNSIYIGKNCWIGANSVILPEVHLGDNTIVAAGAVVNKSFPDGNCILGGIPAKIIKKFS